MCFNAFDLCGLKDVGKTSGTNIYNGEGDMANEIIWNLLQCSSGETVTDSDLLKSSYIRNSLTALQGANTEGILLYVKCWSSL